MYGHEDYFELEFVAGVLGEHADQIQAVCLLLGIVPESRNGETLLARDAVRLLYRRLNPHYVPPEAA